MTAKGNSQQPSPSKTKFMNQSNSHTDGSPTFTIKLKQTDKGFSASSPDLPHIPPANASSSSAAISALKHSIDIAVKSGSIKHG
jgi:hypothetical protein